MGREFPLVREIPWFRPRTSRRPSSPAKRLSAFLEADSDAIADSEGANMFSAFYTALTGDIEWADDPDMPAPYRVVRGWQNG